MGKRRRVSCRRKKSENTKRESSDEAKRRGDSGLGNESSNKIVVWYHLAWVRKTDMAENHNTGRVEHFVVCLHRNAQASVSTQTMVIEYMPDIKVRKREPLPINNMMTWTLDHKLTKILKKTMLAPKSYYHYSSNAKSDSSRDALSKTSPIYPLWKLHKLANGLIITNKSKRVWKVDAFSLVLVPVITFYL